MNGSEQRQLNMLSILGEVDPARSLTELKFADGRVVLLPTAMLESKVASTTPIVELAPQPASLVVPIIEEQIDVTKRTVVTGKVNLIKTVGSYDVHLDELLKVNAWKVERVALHQVVETVPAVRQEGATTIYPLLEERLVLTKELVLVEEIRVSPETSERRDTQTVTLRRESVRIEQEPSATENGTPSSQ